MSLQASFLIYFAIGVCVWLTLFASHTFFRLLRSYRGLRVDSDGSTLAKVDEQTALSEDDSTFLDATAARFDPIGLVHLVDATADFGTVQRLLSIWIVPETGLYVSASKDAIRAGSVSIATEACSVYLDSVAPSDGLNVTTNQWFLLEHGSIVDYFGIHVTPRATTVSRMIAIAWAIVSTERRICRSASSADDHIAFLRRSIEDLREIELEHGFLIPSSDGRLRLSGRRIFGMLVLGLTPLGWLLRSRRRRLLFATQRNALAPLLGDVREGSDVVKAVQDRVRTGSTAPLTQT